MHSWQKHNASCRLPWCPGLVQSDFCSPSRPPKRRVHRAGPELIQTLVMHRKQSGCGTQSTVFAHGIIKIHTIRPWMSFDALLEEPLNIRLWARADLDYRWSLGWQKHGVTVTEMVVQKKQTGSGDTKASYSVHFCFCCFLRFQWDGRTGSTGSCRTGVIRMSFFPVRWQKCFFMTATTSFFIPFYIHAKLIFAIFQTF